MAVKQPRAAFEYRAGIADPTPFEETAPGRLMASMMNIQQRREEKARQERLDAIAAEEVQRRATKEADDRAIQMFELQRQLAAQSERPQEAISFEDRARAGADAAMIPDTPEERAAFAASPVMAKPAAPEITANVGGITLRAPAQDRAELLQQKLDEARKIEMAKGAVELTPEMIAQMPEALRPFLQAGQLQEPPNVSSFLAAQARGESRGPENPEPVTIDGKAVMATPSEIAQAKAQGATVAPYQAPLQARPGEPGQLSPQRARALTNTTNRFIGDAVINKATMLGVTSQIADRVIADPVKASNQLASLYTLVKALDPDSAVREGELDLANATQSYWQQFQVQWNRIGQGQLVHPDAAKELALATKEIANMWNQAAAKKMMKYKAQAQVFGVGNEFEDFLTQQQGPAGGGIDPEVEKRLQALGYK